MFKKTRAPHPSDKCPSIALTFTLAFTLTYSLVQMFHKGVKEKMAEADTFQLDQCLITSIQHSRNQKTLQIYMQVKALDCFVFFCFYYAICLKLVVFCCFFFVDLSWLIKYDANTASRGQEVLNDQPNHWFELQNIWFVLLICSKHWMHLETKQVAFYEWITESKDLFKKTILSLITYVVPNP